MDVDALPDPRPLPTVLQIVPPLDGGGIARATIDTAAALVAAGGDAIVASPGGGMAGELRRLKIEHIAMPTDRDGLVAAWRMARALRELLTGRGVSIIHARTRTAAWAARKIADEQALKVVASVHRPGAAEGWTSRWLDAAQARADRVIAVSDFVARDLRGRHRVPDDRMVTIPAGIALDRFDPATVRAERVIKLAAQWRLPDDRRIILFPGRLDVDRGQLGLVAALGELGREDVFALLIGAQPQAGPLERQIKTMVEALGLGGMVAMAPWCEDMPAAYMLSDVVVAGGEGEGFSRVMVEAQAMSRPVVCGAAGGAVEAILQDVTGWTAPPGVPSALARALDKALGLSPEQRSALSRRARAHVVDKFDVKAMCERTLDVYRALAPGAAP